MTQIRSMLRNERYVGKVIWNKREYFRDPVTKRRRARVRPEKDWIARHVEALRIVSDDLWRTAQDRHRLRTMGGKRGRPRESAKRAHLLTGLLKCGSCGSSMSIVGVRWKNGVAYSSYGCSANRTKGDVICPNSATVSEKRADEAVLSAIAGFIDSGAFETWLREAVDDEARDRKTERPTEVTELDVEIRGQQAQVERAGKALLALPDSEFLAAALRSAEQKLQILRQKLSTATKRLGTRSTTEKFDVGLVKAAVQDIASVARRDPTEARQALAQLVDPIHLRPRPQGGYAAEITLKNTTAALAGGRVLEKYGCGGPMNTKTKTANMLFSLRFTGGHRPYGSSNLRFGMSE